MHFSIKFFIDNLLKNKYMNYCSGMVRNPNCASVSLCVARGPPEAPEGGVSADMSPPGQAGPGLAAGRHEATRDV